MKHLDRKMRLVTYAIAALAVSVLATACGDKNNGGGGNVAVTPVTTPGIGTACVGCPANMGLVSSALSQSKDASGTTQAQLSLNFYGDPAIISQAQASGNAFYTGPVGIGGTMEVRLAKNSAGGCQVPAGVYQLSTLSAGQWDRLVMRNLQVQAVGPTTLKLEIPYGDLWVTTASPVNWAGQSFPYRFQAAVYVTSTTGGYCNAGGYPEYYFYW